MTLYVSLRSQRVGGPVVDAQVWRSDPLAPGPATYLPASEAVVRQTVDGRHVILAVHGFNINRDSGARSLARLEPKLELDASSEVFFGVLWPGDFWLPVVSYPSEAGDAMDSGRRLAAFLNRVCKGAAGISMVSHSLGGRVLLEAVRRLDRPAREAVVTAGAVDDDVFAQQYLDARDNCARLTVLASSRDKVLRLAYPLGDWASDVFFGDKDSPYRRALGLRGPRMPFAAPVFAQMIPDAANYDHGNYFPPSAPTDPKAPEEAEDAKWRAAARFMAAALHGGQAAWKDAPAKAGA